ncbi:MAG: hypothetical protein RL708_1393, partial [Bacteroidota bacterium]
FIFFENAETLMVKAKTSSKYFFMIFIINYCLINFAFN